MARYLTPAKISLLALIELYSEAAVPEAATVPVLSFIIAHLLPSSLPVSREKLFGADRRDGNQTLLISIKDLENLLGPYSAASGVPGRSLWDLLVKKLWDIDSLDALHVFFERIPHLLCKTHGEIQKDSEIGIPPPSPAMILLSRTSPFGTFVRRSQLEFTHLKFHDAIELWKSFVAYRQSTLPHWRKRTPDADNWGFDAVLQNGDEEWGDGTLESFAYITYGDIVHCPERAQGFVSTDDMDGLLEFQVEQMQKLGNRVPDTMRDQLKGVFNSNLMIPSISHYASFLDAWKAGDYPTSFDSLHRFFDYTMQNRDRLFYQYALLNLAVLQADFGCYHEAVAAMQEAVSTARENKDMSCLNFSLCWLYHFGKAYPNILNEADKKTSMLGIETDGLAFLRAKAKESGMWPLWSSTLLSEAKVGLSTGESVAASFENILRSSQLTVTKNMMQNVGVQMMLQSSLWSRLGITHLAWSYCEIFLRSHTQYAPFDDILRTTCRAAYLQTQKGKYDDAMEKLDKLDSNDLRSLRASQYWLLFRGILRLKRELHRNNLEAADQLIAELLQSRDYDPDLAFELDVLHIDALMRRRNYDGALARIEFLSTELRDNGDDLLYRVQLLIMKALLFDRCGRPQKGFSVAVRAASIAWRARLLPVLWQAMAVIANILTSLGEFDASSQILMSVIPRAFECDDCALSAQLFSFLVDAQMGMAGQAKSGSITQAENLTSALDYINRAFAEYSSIEDVGKQCEMMAKKAVVMQLVGDPMLANDFAAEYLDIRKEVAPIVT